MPGAPWEHFELLIGTGHEGFDAELVGVAAAVGWALERPIPEPIYVLLDA